MKFRSSWIASILAVVLAVGAAPAIAAAEPVTRPAAELLGRHPGFGFAGAGVNTATGNYTRAWTDLTFPVGLLVWQRTYNSLDETEGPLGRGWTVSLDAQVVEASDGTVAFHHDDGRVLTFTPDGSGGYRRPQDLDADLSKGADGRFSLRFFAGNETWSFAADGRLAERSREGQRLALERDAEGRLVAATHSAGYGLELAYGPTGRLETVTATDGRVVSYAYAPARTLESVTLPDGTVTRYAFDVAERLALIEDAEGQRVVANAYDPDGRVSRQEFSSGAAEFVYDRDTGVTSVTNASTSARTTYEHNAAGRLVRSVDPAGNAATQAYDADGRLVAVTSRGGASTALAYDAHGNVVRHEAAGAVTTLAYDPLDRVTSVTDPVGGVTRFGYTGDSLVPSELVDPTGALTRATVVDGLVTEAIDPNGARTTYGYDGGRRLTSVTDPVGGTTRFEYDRNGRQVATLTPLGRATRMERDALGRVTERSAPSGARSRYRYSAAGRLLDTTDPTGAVTANQYDAAGRKVSSTDPLGRRTTYTHDADGNVLTATDPGGGVARYTYDELGRQTSVTHRNGALVRYAYDADGRVTETAEPTGTTVTRHDARGNVVETTDAIGRVTRYTYDAADRLIAQTDPTGAVWRTEYDAAGRVVAEIDPTGATTRYAYDAAGRLAVITDPLGRRTQHRYDAAGRLTQVIDPLGGVARYAYDADGRRISETSPAGLVTRYRYDADGHITHLTNPRGSVHRFEFSARGEETASIRPDGAVRRLRYDDAGQLVAAVDPNGGETRYTYDAAGNLTSLTDAKGARRTFGHDPAGQERSFTDALGRTTRRTFDAAGNLTSVTEPSGLTTRQEFNAVNELVRRVGTDGSDVSFTYDGAGRRVTMVDGTGTTRYAYDAAGRLLTVTEPDGGRFTMTYDPASNQTSLQYPDGLKVSYGYDANGNLTGLRSRAGDARFAVDKDGRLLNEKLPGGTERRYRYDGELLVRFEELRGGRHARDTVLTRDADGLVTAQVDGDRTLEYRYDAADQLTVVRDADRGEVLRSGYDEVGNRTSVERDGVETLLRYDAADQLVAADTGDHHLDYRYDLAGRLVEQSDGEQRLALTYDGFGLPATATHTKGKLTSTRRATYDGDDLLVKLTSTTTHGSTRESETTATQYRWSVTDEVPQLLAQRELGRHGGTADADCSSAAGLAAGGDRPDANFVYGFDRVIADARCGSAVFSRDAFGSTIRTDQTKAWAQATEYDPFGLPLGSDHDDRDRGGSRTGWPLGGFGWDRPQFGYRGELAMDATVYLRARLYDTSTGRFTARDPIATRAGQTDVISPYAYANNSPLDFTDPTGELPFGSVFPAGILALIAALTAPPTFNCPDPGNGTDRHDKCFQGVPLRTRGFFDGKEWALNGAEGPLSELWFGHQPERAAQGFTINYLSEERENFLEEFWDIFDKGLNENVDWEVGPRSTALTQSPFGGFFHPTQHRIDIVTDERFIYEVKRWENGRNVTDVQTQLNRYEILGDIEWNIDWEFGRELTDWADGFEVSRNKGFLGLQREAHDVIVWGADPGHVYFEREDGVDDETRAKIKAKKRGGKGRIGGKPPRRR